MQSKTIPVKKPGNRNVEERLSRNTLEKILPARYLLRDNSGEVIETADEMFRRVADAIAEPEAKHGGDPGHWSDEFYSMMTRLEFMPNSPTLMNSGTRLNQLSACFVMSPRDSLNSIFETLSNAAMVFQSGGGVGYSFSHLRPMGEIIKSTNGTASGPVSFMRIYDSMCNEIKQGGKRRGAQMGILRVDHPDIGRFCVAKREKDTLSNFNVSVAVTDEFIECVRRDDKYKLRDPGTGNGFIANKEIVNLYDPEQCNASPSDVELNIWRDYQEIRGIERYRDEIDIQKGEEAVLPAGFIWRLIVDGAWLNGEPGLFIIDETNRDHSFDVEIHPDHWIEATNPCGEQGLENYEACNLGHINLSLVANKDRELFSDYLERNKDRELDIVVDEYLEQAVDWDYLTDLTHRGTRFLDNVATSSRFPVQEIEEKVGEMRKIGLGVMGFAELLIQLGVRYGSRESVLIANRVMAHINHESKKASHELSIDRGRFPVWGESKYSEPVRYSDWFQRHTGLDPMDWSDGYGLRNHSTTTVAPTGTTGMIANTSGGCEPLYNVVYFKDVGRDIQGDDMLVEFHDFFLDVLEANGFDSDEVRRSAVEKLKGNGFRGPRSLDVPDWIADLFVTASEVSPRRHVDMQTAFQVNVDSSISKTINMSNDTSRDEVGKAYMHAIESGCKGITVYRNMSRKEQVMRLSDGEIDNPGVSPDDARCCPIN